jgi:hypothetical protein
MLITIKTAFVQLEGREVPLTRAMVNQLESLHSGWTRDVVTLIGSVSLPDAIVYLFKTPRGLQKSNHIPSGITHVGDESSYPRIILTK